MKWMIFGFIFLFAETGYFGWNWSPSCIAESICNVIGAVMVLYGFIKMQIEKGLRK